MSFVIILLVISVLLFFYKLFSPGRKLVRYAERMPGPKAYPIIGNGLSFFSKKSLLQVLFEFSTTYGSVYRLWLGKQLIVMLSDPADVEVFLASNKLLAKSDSVWFLDSWLGETNLITSNVDIWKIHRKKLVPSFSLKMLENSVEMITRNAEIFVDQLEKELDQPNFDIESYIEKCALDIICETAMGIKLETQLSKNTIYLDSIKTITRILLKRMLCPWLHPELLFKISTDGRTYYKSLKIVLDEGRKVIEQRKKIMEQNGNMSLIPEEEEVAGRKKLQPFLDFLLTQSGFSQTEIEDEVQAFMFAGHETTRTVILFCLYSLTQNENAQNKLYEEIKATFIEKKGDLSYQDYNKMKYLECVIKETMRLYATAPLITRKVTEDLQLPSGYKLPAGALAYIFIFDIHRKEHLYPNPEKFLPERFENQDNSRHSFAYIPFSAGPRNCIGQKFAMIEMKIVLSKLLLHYQFLPAIQTQPLILDTSMVIRSLHKLPIRIKRRSFETI